MSKGLSAVLAACLAASHLVAQEEEPPGPPPPTAEEIAAVPLDDAEVKSLAILVQSHNSIAESVSSGELGQVHNEDMFLYAALGFLRKQVADNPDKQHVVSALQALGRAVADVHEAADEFNREKAKERVAPMTRAFEMVYDFHDRVRVLAARGLADRFTCPMHPEIVGTRVDTCGKCAMALDVPARIRLQPSTSTSLPRLVYATVRTDKALEVGQEIPAVLSLKSRIEAPIQLFELREVHTKKIHLLIIDESLTDYHHEHPVPAEAPGEYRFTFTPRKPGPYRAWADVQPLLTGVQEYAKTDIVAPGSAPGEPMEKAFPRVGEHEGLKYELTLASETIKAGEPVAAHVKVTGADGKPFTGLEPLMGAFAHLVGFHEDRKTILHMHPIETRKLEAADRGGPDLDFRIYTDTPGYYRLFFQVQIGGMSKFIPFGIDVVPR
jgi:hypothetical protein